MFQDPLTDLPNPMVGISSFTMEAKIYSTHASGNRIISWRGANNSGFEWVAPRGNCYQASYYANKQHFNIGKPLKIKQWYILGLTVDRRQGKQTIITSYIDGKLDGRNIENNWGTLDNSEKACVGNWIHMKGHQFNGNIEYVKIWKDVGIAPYV